MQDQEKGGNRKCPEQAFPAGKTAGRLVLSNDVFFAEVEEAVAAGRSVRIMVRGTSMLPLLRSGKDEVELDGCRPEEVSVGDVLLFRYHGSYVMHRLLRIAAADAGTCGGNACFLMRGDGSFKAREVCSAADIVARVACVYRPSGRGIRTDSFRWRICSRLWLSTGIFRTPVLRMIHFCLRKK